MNFLLGNTLIGLGQVISAVIWLFLMIIIIRVVLSWLTAFGVVSVNPYNPVVRLLHDTTEPIANYVRRYVKPIGMIDISFIVVGLLLMLLDTILVRTLIQVGLQLSQGL